MWTIISGVLNIIASPVTKIFEKYQDRKIVEIETGALDNQTKASVLIAEENAGKSWRSKVLLFWGKIIGWQLVWNYFLVPIFTFANSYCSYFHLLPKSIINTDITVVVMLAIGGYVGIEKWLLRK